MGVARVAFGLFEQGKVGFPAVGFVNAPKLGPGSPVNSFHEGKAPMDEVAIAGLVAPIHYFVGEGGKEELEGIGIVEKGLFVGPVP